MNKLRLTLEVDVLFNVIFNHLISGMLLSAMPWR